jgi:hypothetical protein
MTSSRTIMAQEPPQSQDSRAFVRQQSAPIIGQQHSAHTSAAIPSVPTLHDRDKEVHIRNVTKRRGLGLLVAPCRRFHNPHLFSLRFHNAVCPSFHSDEIDKLGSISGDAPQGAPNQHGRHQRSVFLLCYGQVVRLPNS